MADFTVQWPLRMVEMWRITQTFAEHLQRKKQLGLKYYNGGVDIYHNVGEPILASASGKVSKITIGDSTGYGNVVYVDHGNGYLSLYAHLTSVTVRASQTVQAGDQVGTMGSTGNSTGPHVHWELRHNGTPVDPMLFLSVAKVVGPVEQPAVKIELPTFPPLPKARTIVDYLNIRSQPSVVGQVAGALMRDTIVSVIEAVKDDVNVWLRIGHNQYVAMIYNGEKYLEWL